MKPDQSRVARAGLRPGHLRALRVCWALVLLVATVRSAAASPRPGESPASSSGPTVAPASCATGDIELASYVIAGGGGESADGDLVLEGTAGQPDASDSLVAYPFTLYGGYWAPLTQATSVVGVPDDAGGRRLAFAPVYPNPATGIAYVHWSLPRPSKVNLTVYDVQGRVVAVLADGFYAGGQHGIAWDPGHGNGGLRTGIYLVRLRAADVSLVRRVVVLR